MVHTDDTPADLAMADRHARWSVDVRGWKRETMQLGSQDPQTRMSDGSTDRAVSPVIGVILMVAITVILAAVIGVFVMGLTEDLGEGAAPTNSISIDGEIDTATSAPWIDMTISHDNGDSVVAEEMEIVLRYDGATEDSVGFDNPYSEEEFSVGDTLTVNSSDASPFSATATDSVGEVTVQIVHNPSDSVIAETDIELV